MKKLILIGLIISFYFIQISYNGLPIESVGSGLFYSLKTGYLIGIYLSYIFINLFFILWYLTSKNYYSILFIIISILIWFYFKTKFDGIIDTKIFFSSSIIYLMFSLLSIVITAFSINQSTTTTLLPSHKKHQ